MPFSSMFRDAASDMASAINETMGETVTVFPYAAKPNYSPVPDASRPAFSVAMVFTHKSEMAFSDKSAYRPSGSRETDVAIAIQTRRPVFSVKACDLPYPLRQKDRLQRCWDKTEWEITSVKPDGISRIEIDVVQSGRTSQLDRSEP